MKSIDKIMNCNDRNLLIKFKKNASILDLYRRKILSATKNFQYSNALILSPTKFRSQYLEREMKDENLRVKFISLDEFLLRRIQSYLQNFDYYLIEDDEDKQFLINPFIIKQEVKKEDLNRISEEYLAKIHEVKIGKAKGYKRDAKFMQVYKEYQRKLDSLFLLDQDDLLVYLPLISKESAYKLIIFDNFYKYNKEEMKKIMIGFSDKNRYIFCIRYEEEKKIYPSFKKKFNLKSLNFLDKEPKYRKYDRIKVIYRDALNSKLS